MSEIEGIDPSAISLWFERLSDEPFFRVRLRNDAIEAITEQSGPVIRRCYVSDSVLRERMREGHPLEELIRAKLPGPGSVMSGDFGEILTYLWRIYAVLPAHTVGPKKWRLKQDPSKPAPYSDVIHFLLPEWPNASNDDVLFCAEVKSKATQGTSTPVIDCMRDCRKDQTKRLASTLVWLRDRALFEDLGGVSVDEIERFLQPDRFPAAKKDYSAVAVLCESVVEHELVAVPEVPPDMTLVVIIVPNLKACYERAFVSAHRSSQDFVSE